MRTRAYRPEAPDALEGRSLLSGAAADPVVVLPRKLNSVYQQINNAFYQFDRGGDAGALLGDISDAVAMIPFGRADGLGVEINGIVAQMRHRIAAGDHDAPGVAYHAILDATRAEVLARVRTGDVVIH